ncbi:MAG: hypothetical protein ACLVGW_04230 [Evtepia gabavorous]
MISGWAAFGGFVSIIPWEAIQITDVLGYLIPGLTDGEPLYYVAGTGIHLTTIIIGVICSFLLFALNMRGLAAAAGVQKILCSSRWVPLSSALWPLCSTAAPSTGSPL